MNALSKKRKEREQYFHVHFVEHENFDLREFLEQLQARYHLVFIDEDNKKFRTIKIKIKPSHLRHLLHILPKYIPVSYEAL